MNKSQLFRTIIRISVAAFLVGILFRIQHWPYGSKIALTGLVGIGISSYFFYSSKLVKSYIDRLAVVLIPLWCVFMIARIAHVPYRLEINMVLILLAVMWSVNLGLKINREDNQEGILKFNWERNAFILGVILVGIGVILKSQHFPYATLCLLSGIGSAMVSYLLGMFSKNQDEV